MTFEETVRILIELYGPISFGDLLQALKNSYYLEMMLSSELSEMMLQLKQMNQPDQEDLMYEIRDAIDEVMPKLPHFVLLHEVSSAVSKHLGRDLSDRDAKILQELAQSSILPG